MVSPCIVGAWLFGFHQLFCCRNYISAPVIGEKFFYRWWADEEFGNVSGTEHIFP